MADRNQCDHHALLSHQIVHPLAATDKHLDPKLTRAATIAQERRPCALPLNVLALCQRSLARLRVIDSRPKSEYARDAEQDLVSNYGLKKLSRRSLCRADRFSAGYGTSRSASVTSRSDEGRL